MGNTFCVDYSAPATQSGDSGHRREDRVNFAALAIAELYNGDWPTEWIVNPELKAN